MNFSKLLATGKSMIGMRDAHSPYRMRTENLLPKFESAKNPFGAMTKMEVVVAKVEPVVEAVVTPVVVKPQTAIMETSLLFDAQLQPVANVAPVMESRVESVAIPSPRLCSPVGAREEEAVVGGQVKPAVVTPVAKVATRSETPTISKAATLAGWAKKVNPLAYLPSREGEKPARVRMAVQTELSLERVKVMRNDLNDTDLEVVAVRTAPTPEFVGPKLQPMAANETTLNRLTSRFFGAGQTQA